MTTEWTGGFQALHGFVMGEGEPYCPETLLWLGANGRILGSTLAPPGELLALAGDSLQEAIENPLAGPPHRPDRVRVESPELAKFLRASHPDIEIVCAPTPDVDEVLDQMCQALAERGEDATGFLHAGIEADAMAAFFEAAAALYRVKPWEVVPDEELLFSVSVPAMGVEDLVITVIGQMGESFGVVLFWSLHDHEAYQQSATASALGQDLEIPPHMSLNFDRGAEIPSAARKEVARHGWEVAGADAYPWLIVADDEGHVRLPSATELTIVEVAARALAAVLLGEEALNAAWDGADPLERTLLVPTYDKTLEVTVRTPVGEEAMEPLAVVEAGLSAIAYQGRAMNHEARAIFEEDLIRLFERSPEAQRFDAVGTCRHPMDLAARVLGETILTLDAPGLREVLFDLLPRKANILPKEARPLVEELRALYRFLRRELELEQADACLRVLGGSAIKKLETKLSEIHLPAIDGPAPGRATAGPKPKGPTGTRRKKKRKETRKSRKRSR